MLLEAAAVGLSDAVVNPSQVGFIGFARPLRLARPQRSNYRGNMYTGIGLAMAERKFGELVMLFSQGWPSHHIVLFAGGQTTNVSLPKKRAFVW